MTQRFFDVCSVVFVLSGLVMPPLIFYSGRLDRRQNRHLEGLEKELGKTDGKKQSSSEKKDAILARLPKLKPLNCPHCGAGVLLEPTDTLCPNCHQRGPLPPDYAAVTAIKARLALLVKSAVRYWKVAKVLTYPLMGFLFFVLILAPLVLTTLVMIGYTDHPDRSGLYLAYDHLSRTTPGKTVLFILLFPAFCSVIPWMAVFGLLTGMGSSLRSKLPAIPVFSKEVRARETAVCQACGGIEYGAGDFACVCPYCRVENYRVQFAHLKRLEGQDQTTATKSVLFGAMQITEEYAGTFFFIALALEGLLVLTFIGICVKAWVGYWLGD